MIMTVVMEMIRVIMMMIMAKTMVTIVMMVMLMMMMMMMTKMMMMMISSPQNETHECDASDVLGPNHVQHGVSSVWKHCL